MKGRNNTCYCNRMRYFYNTLPLPITIHVLYTKRKRYKRYECNTLQYLNMLSSNILLVTVINMLSTWLKYPYQCLFEEI